MAIDVRKVLSGEVNKMVIDYDFSLEDGDYPFDTKIDSVVFTAPIHIDGTIVNMGGYVRLTATVNAKYDAECALCLTPLMRNFAVEFERTVVGKGELANTSEDDGEDYIEVADGMLDIELAAAEQLMMEFPMREVCSEDCKGLCMKCGKNLNEGDCTCPKKEIDPRLAILQKLLEK